MVHANRFFRKPSSLFSFLVLAGFFVLFHFLYPLAKRPSFDVSKQKSVINFKTDFLKFVSLGQYRLLSSLYWVETLLFSDIEHYEKQDMKSWIYLRLKNIITLDPYFYDPYLWGGMYLSIIKDDLLGAADIFERGLKYFPNDYHLHFHAGFNYYHQLHNYTRAIELFEKVQDHPEAPLHLRRVVARLKANEGSLKDAFSVLKIAYETTPPQTSLKAKLFNDLYAIKAEIDLTCLNEKKKNCARRDINGHPYIFERGRFKAKRKWVPYRYMASKKKAL